MAGLYDDPAITKQKAQQGAVGYGPATSIGGSSVTAQDPNWNQGYQDISTYSSGPAPAPQAPAPQPQPQAPAPQAQQAAPQVSPIQQAFQGSLLSMFQKSQQPPSITDPALAAQSETFRAGQQRSAERQRSQLAERMAHQGFASGGAGGALDAGIQQIGAQRGLNEATYDAGLVGNEVSARREELMQAMQLAASIGNQEAARELQKELSMLDIGLRGRGLDIQENLGGQDVGLRKEAIQQQGSLGRGDLALRMMLGMQGNQLAYDQLGLGAGQWLMDFNQDNFMNYMGGF
jgi:hypothetical protein